MTDSTPRDPLAGAPAPQPMTPERIALLRSNTANWLSLSQAGSDIDQLADHVLECLDEIDRFRDELEQIETLARNALTRPFATLDRIEELAREALGEAVPDDDH